VTGGRIQGPVPPRRSRGVRGPASTAGRIRAGITGPRLARGRMDSGISFKLRSLKPLLAGDELELEGCA
jgi:hypothetical protein